MPVALVKSTSIISATGYPCVEVVGIAEAEAAVPATQEWAKQFGITNVVSDPAALIEDQP